MATSCPLGYLHITDLHRCVADAGPLSVPLALFAGFLLQHRHAICPQALRQLARPLLLSRKRDACFQVSLIPLSHSLFPSHLSLLCFILVICFLALFCFFQQTSLFLISLLMLLCDVGQTLCLAMSQSLLTQEGYIIKQQLCSQLHEKNSFHPRYGSKTSSVCLSLPS